jgi:DNA gyrase subunit A
VATKSANRKTYVEYLEKSKFTYSDYLADMPIYRMTKEEVEKRVLMVKDDSAKLEECKKIAKSDALVRKKLIEELRDVGQKLDEWMKKSDEEKKQQIKKSQGNQKKK